MISEGIEISKHIEDEKYVPTKPGNLPSTKTAIDRAKEENLKVVYPKVDEIQLDIDSEEAYTVWVGQRKILNQYFPIQKVVETRSKTEGHWHITVTLGVSIPHPIQRLALQAILGSDRKRELLGYIMATLGHENRPTLFLEKE